MAQITTNGGGIRMRGSPRAPVGKVRTLAAFAITGLACLVLTGAARAQSNIKGWGSLVVDSGWNSETAFVEVAAGGGDTVVRRSDGTVVAWGDNKYGECNVPALPAGVSYVQVAAGGGHTVARRSDGAVVAWGYNYTGQCNVPALPAGVACVEGAARGLHAVARLSDGSAVAWGMAADGQWNVSALRARWI